MKYTAEQLRGKTLVIDLQIPIDFDAIGWTNEIKDRIGDDEVTEEQLFEFALNEILEQNALSLNEIFMNYKMKIE